MWGEKCSLGASPDPRKCGGGAGSLDPSMYPCEAVKMHTGMSLLSLVFFTCVSWRVFLFHKPNFLPYSTQHTCLRAYSVTFAQQQQRILENTIGYVWMKLKCGPLQ